MFILLSFHRIEQVGRIAFTWGRIWWNELKEAASKACPELAKGQKSKVKSQKHTVGDGFKIIAP
jgi:hypothetical protein